MTAILFLVSFMQVSLFLTGFYRLPKRCILCGRIAQLLHYEEQRCLCDKWNLESEAAGFASYLVIELPCYYRINIISHDWVFRTGNIISKISRTTYVNG